MTKGLRLFGPKLLSNFLIIKKNVFCTIDGVTNGVEQHFPFPHSIFHFFIFILKVGGWPGVESGGGEEERDKRYLLYENCSTFIFETIFWKQESIM